MSGWDASSSDHGGWATRSAKPAHAGGNGRAQPQPSNNATPGWMQEQAPGPDSYGSASFHGRAFEPNARPGRGNPSAQPPSRLSTVSPYNSSNPDLKISLGGSSGQQSFPPSAAPYMPVLAPSYAPGPTQSSQSATSQQSFVVEPTLPPQPPKKRSVMGIAADEFPTATTMLEPISGAGPRRDSRFASYSVSNKSREGFARSQGAPPTFSPSTDLPQPAASAYSSAPALQPSDLSSGWNQNTCSTRPVSTPAADSWSSHLSSGWNDAPASSTLRWGEPATTLTNPPPVPVAAPVNPAPAAVEPALTVWDKPSLRTSDGWNVVAPHVSQKSWSDAPTTVEKKPVEEPAKPVAHFSNDWDAPATHTNSEWTAATSWSDIPSKKSDFSNVTKQQPHRLNSNASDYIPSPDVIPLEPVAPNRASESCAEAFSAVNKYTVQEHKVMSLNKESRDIPTVTPTGSAVVVPAVVPSSSADISPTLLPLTELPAPRNSQWVTCPFCHNCFAHPPVKINQ